MEEHTVKLSENEVQLITQILQYKALKLQNEGANREYTEKISNLAYKFQELQQDPKLRDKPQNP